MTLAIEPVVRVYNAVAPDGRAVRVDVDYKGDLVPGYGPTGGRFSALTLWYRCRVGDVDREGSVQLPKAGHTAGDLHEIAGDAIAGALREIGAAVPLSLLGTQQ